MKGRNHKTNRKSDDPYFCTYTDEELEFLKAIDKYKSDYHRMYPNCKEVLYVAKCLGYKKVIDESNKS